MSFSASLHRCLAAALVCVAGGSAGARAACVATPGDLVFEAPVASNGVAVTPDGSRILVVNPANGSLSVIDAVTTALEDEIAVGLEPVSVAVHPGGGFAYVANHVSDSVSVVDLADDVVVATIQEVVPATDSNGDPNPDAGRTLFDEPAMVLFSADGARAFVTLTQMDQLAVIDTANHSVVARVDFGGTLTTSGGQRVFLDGPRAMALLGTDHLAVAAFASGNQTQNNFNPGPPPPPTPESTAADIRTEQRCYRGSSVCDRPELVSPDCRTRCQTVNGPREQWISRNLNIRDRDLVILHLPTLTPVEVLSRRATLIYGLASSPGATAGSHRILLAHTDAQNDRNGLSQIGLRPWLNRLSEVLFDEATGVGNAITRDLDAPPLEPVDPAAPAAIPYAVAVSADGATIWVTASGSGRLLKVDAQWGVQERLVVGANPTALALNPVRDELYVFNRVDGTLTVVDTQAALQVRATVAAGSDPLPPAVRAGARVVHDAGLSGNGSFACASCHPSADTDRLVWDLDPTTVEEDGPRLTQSLRGLRGTADFHWDGEFASLKELVTGTVTSLMQGTVSDQAATDAETYLLDIAHMPSPTRRPDDRLTDPARDGIRTFFTHEQGRGITCASASCHAPPFWSSAVVRAGVEAPSLRALYDRKPGLHDGIALNRDFITFFDRFIDIYDDWIDWRSGLRSTLLIEFGESFVPQHAGLESWFEQMSTGLPAALGRQVTLTQATMSDPAVRAIEQQLWQEASRQKVLLTADGRLRAGPSWEWLHLRWDEATQTFCRPAAPPMDRPTLEAAIAAGDAMVTYTARLWSEGEAPIPQLHAVCDGCSPPTIGQLEVLDPTVPHRLSLFGDGLTGGLRLLLDGAPVSETVRLLSSQEAEIDFADLHCCCGQLVTLQVQNPQGRLSNEIPLQLERRPVNDAGPGRFVCEGATIDIGTPGLAGVDYSWSPSTGLADPTQPYTTVLGGVPGTLIYTRTATIAGTTCASTDDVTLSVVPSGSVALASNNYRVIKRGQDVVHIWQPVAGTDATTLFSSAQRDLASPVQLAVVPVASSEWTETGALNDDASAYYYFQPDSCP